MVGGILSNPFEIVFTRMQADGMYPESQRRNYRSFVDGLVKVTEEGALFRGAMANGLKLGGDYLDKTILNPNNINYPSSRLLFINYLM